MKTFEEYRFSIPHNKAKVNQNRSFISYDEFVSYFVQKDFVKKIIIGYNDKYYFPVVDSEKGIIGPYLDCVFDVAQYDTMMWNTQEVIQIAKTIGEIQFYTYIDDDFKDSLQLKNIEISDNFVIITLKD